jgi:hypothetical protein
MVCCTNCLVECESVACERVGAVEGYILALLLRSIVRSLTSPSCDESVELCQSRTIVLSCRSCSISQQFEVLCCDV